MRDNFSDIEIAKMIVLADKYKVSVSKVHEILNCVYEKNIDNDLITVELVLVQLEGK